MKSQQIRTIFLVAPVCLAVLFTTAPSLAAPFKWPTAKTDGNKPTQQPAASDNADSIKTPPAVSDTAPDTTPVKTEPPPAKKEVNHPEAVKHYNRGVELHQSGFLNQAIEEYSQAINCDANLEQAWSNLGTIYTAQRSYTKAMQSFEKALELKPDRPTTLNGLATVLYARGKQDEALEKWKQAIQIDPRFASAYYNIGEVLENEKKPYDAVAQYVKAISVSPRMSDPYYRIGTIYFKERHPAQAKLMLSKALQLASPDADFAKDAKSKLQSIDGEFASEGDRQADVQMNVVPPQGESAQPAVVEKPAGQAQSTQASDASAEEPAAKKKGLFSHKHKKADLFVAPSPDNAQASQSDLKEKPAE